MESIDTFNKFAVAAGPRLGGVTILNLRQGAVLSKAEALNLAAYLVSMTFSNRDEFDQVLTAIQST